MLCRASLPPNRVVAQKVSPPPAVLFSLCPPFCRRGSAGQVCRSSGDLCTSTASLKVSIARASLGAIHYTKGRLVLQNAEYSRY